MITDIIEVNNFILQKEYSFVGADTVEVCDVQESGLGFVFYDLGKVDLGVKYGQKTDNLEISSGMATSFFFSKEVTFTHRISGEKPLRSILISSSKDYLEQLVHGIAETHPLAKLLNPQDDFVLGEHFYMNQEMHLAVQKVFNTTYTGAALDLFVEAQSLELMAHFLGMSSSKTHHSNIKKQDRERLHFAQEIIMKNLEEPPSLKELAKLVGINEYKLKKGFKQLFDLPVYKFLQVKRLEHAHNLLRNKEVSVQEAAFSVGYESLSSFSNAFLEKYGYRPSRIRR